MDDGRLCWIKYEDLEICPGIDVFFQGERLKGKDIFGQASRWKIKCSHMPDILRFLFFSVPRSLRLPELEQKTSFLDRH